MNGIVYITDLTAKQDLSPVSLDTTLTGQLGKMKGLCEEEDAKFRYKAFSIHHKGVERYFATYYSTEYYKIDPFFNPMAE